MSLAGPGRCHPTALTLIIAHGSFDDCYGTSWSAASRSLSKDVYFLPSDSAALSESELRRTMFQTIIRHVPALKTGPATPPPSRTWIVALVALVGPVPLGCSRRDPTAEIVSRAVEAPHALPMTRHPDSPTLPTLPDGATGMVRVTGGTFRMHAAEWHAGQEVIVHPPSNMTVESFELDATEVTAGAYLQCVKGGACGALRPDFSSNSACTATKAEMALRPMECITWFEATAYCQAQGKRLPTEIEWEYAARGGPKNTDYPWGNDDPERPLALLCWTGSGTWRSETCRVASFPAEAFGTYDLAGNVAEWTSTVEASAYIVEKKAKPHPYRVVRGGSSGTNVRRGIVGHRLEDADYNGSGIGLRCARDGSPR